MNVKGVLWLCATCLAAVGVMIAGSGGSFAQTIEASTCNSGTNNPPACNQANVRGDRSEGWYPQGRSEVMARNGMVTTSQPLAAQAGLRILMEGGNAIDAAIAVASTLNLVEPMNTGLAGDVFAIVYIARKHKLYALDASGKAPSHETLAYMNSNGYFYNPANFGPGSGMPSGGITTVTVPGALWGWDALLRRFGTMSFSQVLAPAIDYAQNGFPVSERIAHDWNLPNAEGPIPSSPKGCCTQLDPDSVAIWYINGQPPVAGQIYSNPELAHTFELVAEQGKDVFYKGPIARAIVAKSNALGGTMTLRDLANYSGEWVTPATTNYHGEQVYELPPPSQGWAAVEMLNILSQCIGTVYPGETLASLGPQDPRYWNMLVQAKKLAYTDLYTYNGDPAQNPGLLALVYNKLTTPSYAASLCHLINPNHAPSAKAGRPSGIGDTTVASVADQWGNMVSWVNSNYDGFGSGISIPGYGFVLHNRGALFTLNPKSPNVIAPNKRPYNTLMAGFGLGQDGTRLSIGLMGGDMQAQGHAQMFVNLVDLGANLQASTDLARFYDDQVGDTLLLETPLYDMPVGSSTMGTVLANTYGYKVVSTSGGAVGGYQAILFTPVPGSNHESVNGFYRAGSDHRKDGEAVGW